MTRNFLLVAGAALAVGCDRGVTPSDPLGTTVADLTVVGGLGSVSSGSDETSSSSSSSFPASEGSAGTDESPAEVPPDYRSTPIGWVHQSCLHEVPNGARVDVDNNVFVSGKIVAHYDPCPYAPILSAPFRRSTGGGSGGPVGPGCCPNVTSGWLEWVNQNATIEYPWDEISGTLQVMTDPENDTDDAGVEQTLYFWQGLQSDESSPPSDGCGILQPVLQWGYGPAGGGEFWSYDSWWWNNHWNYSPPQYLDGFYTTLITASVNTNDYIDMDMVYDGVSEWEITAVDVTNGLYNDAYLAVSDVCPYDNYYVAVEYDTGLGTITNCGEVPHQAHFTDIELFQGYPSLNSYDGPLPSDVSFHFHSGLISCEWALAAGYNTSTNVGYTTLTMK